MTEYTVDAAIEHHRKSHEIFYDFQWKSIVQTIEVITRGVGFYTLILVAVAGAIYQSRLSGRELNIALAGVTFMTLFLMIAFGFLSWGVFTALKDLQKTLRSLNEIVFHECELEAYFTRARTVAIAVMACSVFGVLVILLALLALKLF